MNSIFSDLDQLIEQAVAKATNTEKSLQKKQEKSVKDRGLEADNKDEVDEVDEAEDDEKKDDKSGDESIEKIKGKPPEGAEKSSKSDKKTDDEVPGTKTSKKLADPPEKSLINPKFDDISNKINTLRGSGSLRDEKVSSAVKAYIGTLKPAERSALLTYLTNLSQIMTTVKGPDDVKDPRKVGIKTTFKKSSSKDEIPSSPGKEEKETGSSGVIVVGGK